ncbi:MAG: prealbumin-like fold domain-containing protein [Acidimicrobiales bacterium]
MIAVLAASGVAPVSAVHDDGLFEIGPAQAADILGDGAIPDTSGPDWADVFDGNGNLVGLGAGGVAAAFIIDDLAAKGATDGTTFSGAGGSNKNNDAVSTADCAQRVPPLVGSACDIWQWDAGNVPAKDDLSNVYAYGAFDAEGHLIIYAGVERLAPEGDSHVDIEFLSSQLALDEAVPCNDPGNDATPCKFNGVRTPGDVIVSMDYVQGGGIGEVHVREWNGTEYVEVGIAGGEGCFTGDDICVFNNGGLINGGPWKNYERGGAEITDLAQNAFTEFGIDVTALLGETPCLSTIMAKTRSSASFTAELKDFAGPAAFSICGAQIAIGPSAVNEVGDPHTFTVNVDQKLGSTTSPAPDGTIVTVTLTPANGAVVNVSANTCATGTVGGACTVTFTSGTAGTVTGHAAADIVVANQTFHVETDGQGTNSGDALKRFVDAAITIDPDDTNSVGESHTFTVAVTVDDGSAAGVTNAPDGTKPTVTLTDAGGAAAVVSANTCATPGTVNGACSVTFSSATAGTVTGHASVTLAVFGLSITRETDASGANSNDAVKTFVAGSLAWKKVDNAGALQGGATFEVCRTHNLNTGTGQFDDITDVCVSVVDNSAPDTDGDAGEFLLTGLRLGRYTVRETVAPAGFVADPDTVTRDLTLAAPIATISEAFVNNRPIVKLTEFGYTNAPNGTPTAGVTSGTTVFTAKIKNFGGAATALSGSLTVTPNAGTVLCPASPVALTDPSLVPGEEVTFSVTCTYTAAADSTVVTASLISSYLTNGLSRTISGSPATISFTIQGD